MKPMPCKGSPKNECSSSNCRWASGKKRSFCRSKYNFKHVGDEIYLKKPTKKKSACGKRSKTGCTSPCKWAQGSKRSFCRTMKNKSK